MDNFPINLTMSGLSGDGGGCDVAANVMIDGSVSPSTSSGVSSLGSSYVVSGSNGYARVISLLLKQPNKKNLNMIRPSLLSTENE